MWPIRGAGGEREGDPHAASRIGGDAAADAAVASCPVIVLELRSPISCGRAPRIIVIRLAHGAHAAGAYPG